MVPIHEESCAVCDGPVVPGDDAGLCQGHLVHRACFVDTATGRPIRGDGAPRATAGVILARAATREQYVGLKKLFAPVEWIDVVPDRRQGQRRRGERRQGQPAQDPGRRRADRRIDRDIERTLRAQGWAIAWFTFRA